MHFLNVCHLVLGSTHVAPKPEGSALVGHVLVERVKVVHKLDDLPHRAGDIVAVKVRHVAVEQPVRVPCFCFVIVAIVGGAVVLLDGLQSVAQDMLPCITYVVYEKRVG